VTVAEALREGRDRLTSAGIEHAMRDAELLLRHVCDWDQGRLITSSKDTLAADKLHAFRDLVTRRVRRHPLQHLTGQQAFWRHDFMVTPAVLIPRPETEIMVEAALERLKDVPTPTIVDVGTGSGCIALSIAAERRDARVFGVDTSAEALAVARENRDRIGVAQNVTLLMGDLLAGLPLAAGSVDAILSNPPYIDPTERDSLPPEVRDHEPASALFAPEERYSVYRRLIPAAHRLLAAHRFLLVEVGIDMADEVSHLCKKGGFHVDIVLRDLQDIPRIVVAHKR
jgi:release factor glutamine methyltransferase